MKEKESVTEPMCPLCEKSEQAEQLPKKLYGQGVCRRCYNTFATKRELAFLLDVLVINGLIFLVGLALIRSGALHPSLRTSLGWQGLSWLFLTLKDGFNGHSPGKVRFGLQVVDASTGQPAGFRASFKRNLPLLLPVVPLVVALQLRRGKRLGDEWAGTRVIWKAYQEKAPFAGHISPPVDVAKVLVETHSCEPRPVGVEHMNPWISMGLKPQQTVHYILETGGGRSVLMLAMLVGVARALMQVNHTALAADLQSILGVVAIALVGVVVGLASLYLGGWLYRWIGSWFGGQAKAKDVRTALAWAQVPMLAVFTLWFVIFLTSPAWGMISSDGHLTGRAGAVASVVLIVAGAVGMVWQAILTVHALAVAHRFSAWKGFGTLGVSYAFLIPLAPIVIPIMLWFGFPNIAVGGDLIHGVLTRMSSHVTAEPGGDPATASR